MKKLSLLILLFITYTKVFAFTTNDNPSINRKNIISVDTVQAYSILVSGHFHGSSKNTSGYPAKTLRENINSINNSGAALLICLGDLFLDIKNDIPIYKSSFIDKLNMPLYTAPGNHDISGDVYEKNFGKSYYSFRVKSELYIVLNTELDDGSIEGDQLNMLKNAISYTEGIKNIFVFSHRLIWAEEHPKMDKLFTDNTRSANGNNFQSEILPLFKKLKKGIKIYFFGGSLGNAPSPFFYHKENNIHYIATAIRDTPKDAMLKLDIKNGEIELSSFPLLMSPKYYNLEYYKGTKKKDAPFNWRLVPLYIKTMLGHRYFWYGALLMVSGFAFYFIIKRKRKK